MMLVQSPFDVFFIVCKGFEVPDRNSSPDSKQEDDRAQTHDQLFFHYYIKPQKNKISL
ncbi:MAG: hypothetical protein HW382_34 [Deltaproteobacteria bacterium]|nr:hypothetical protein [Deltaproteobacteria bacterium]